MAVDRAAALERLAPFAFVLLAVCGFQYGAALVTPLFAIVGAQGASALRLGFAAAVLVAAVRPWRAPVPLRVFPYLIGFGLGIAGLNLFFYFAIRTLPLGVTVAIEFAGPLTVAVLTSRRVVHGLWVLLAAAGICLLLPLRIGMAHLDPTGLAWAGLSACCWATYIVCGDRVTAAISGQVAAALGVSIAALVVLPFGIAHAGAALLRPDVLPLAMVVAVVSASLPYLFEMLALKRMPARVFGTLMSLEPAFGALFGFLMLDQHLTAVQGAAIAAIVTASVGTSLTNRTNAAVTQ